MEINKLSEQKVHVISESAMSEKAEETKTEQPEKQEGVMKRENEITLKKDYTAISKDGDTLEITEKPGIDKCDSKLAMMENSSTSPAHMSEAALAKCSKNKLRQLLLNGQISKQQYDRVMKKADQ